MNSLFAIVIISLIFSAFFSGMEIAFVSANKLKLELDRKQNLFYTRFVDVFLKNPSEYISTMLIGNNIALVMYGIAFAKMLNEPIRNILNTNSDTIVLVFQTILSTLLVLITAEFLPKTLCKINPNGVLRVFSTFALFFYILLFPITKLISWMAKLLLKICGHKIDKIAPQKIFNRSDLVQLTTEASDKENGNEHEIKIFQNALDFPDVKIRECMIPRTEIEAIEENETIEELKEKFIKSGYTRIPIYRETIDNIIGYINSKDLFKKTEKVKALMRQIHFYPETMQAEKLLKTFIKKHQSLAVVVDEFGGTAGIISIEDILEEILGEIEDEHDSDELVEKQTDKNKFIFSGRLEVEYINATYKLEIPESEEYETLAGFILHQNENIPKHGDIIYIEKFRFKILKMSGSRIDLIELSVENQNKKS